MAHIGNQPFGKTVRTITTETLASVKTQFYPTGGYTIGYVDVYLNGVRLTETEDFTATNGTLVTLTFNPLIGDTVDIVSYGTVEIANALRRDGDTLVGTLYTRSLIPTSNVTYDIGSSTMRYKDLYLSGNTISLGDINLSTNGTSFSVANSTGGVYPSALGNTTVTGTVTVSSTVNVGANVNLSTSQINVGNSTVNTTITNVTVSTNTVNVTSTINVGANVNLSTSQINVGNNTVNTVISATSITTTGNLSVSGNTTLGDASTDTVLMTGAPSIGGAGLGMGMGFRNRIINGAMVIDQRNAGASVTNSLNNLFAVDRWITNLATEYHNNVVSQQNLDSLTPPANFKNYLGVKVTTGTVAPASPFLSLRQLIEGYNVADLGFGTSSAQTLTCSFWARSNLAGTYAFLLRGGTPTRSYVTNFTINLANTWEFKTFVIPGDTDTGVVWDSTNGSAFLVNIGLNAFQGTFATSTLNQWQTGLFAGSTTQSNNFVTTTGNAFYLAGVQLEKGSTATAFDYRPNGTELALCQRYYQEFNAAESASAGGGLVGVCGTTSIAVLSGILPVEMRTTPSFNFNNIVINFGGGTSAVTSTAGFYSGKKAIGMDLTVTGTPLTVGRAAVLQFTGGQSAANRWFVTAEF